MKFKLLIISLLISSSVLGQDSHISQFYTSPLLINPAMTGMMEDNFRANLIYRNQWSAIIPDPFVTVHASYDQPYKKFGIGASLQNNRAGAGGFNVLNFLLSGSYEVTIDPKNIHNLTTGIQLGFIQKSVDSQRLLFDNQWTENNGGSFDPLEPSGENFEKTSFIVPDANFGIYYYYNNKSSRFNPYFSISGFHLTSPKETFFGEENKMPVRFVSYWGSKIKFDELIKLEPNFIVMKQENNYDVQFGMLGYYFLEESNAWLFVGPYYRNKDAVVVHAGVVYGEYRVGLSYDINISPLSNLSNYKGGLEISIIYTNKKNSYIPSI